MTELRAGCCVVGGGPAGMMTALLFARAGVSTVLLEKHADFLRDFRGDTIHPSTLAVFEELGVLESFLKRPHQEVTTLAGNLGDTLVTVCRLQASADALQVSRLYAAMGFSQFSRPRRHAAIRSSTYECRRAPTTSSGRTGALPVCARRRRRDRSKCGPI